MDANDRNPLLPPDTPPARGTTPDTPLDTPVPIDLELLQQVGGGDGGTTQAPRGNW